MEEYFDKIYKSSIAELEKELSRVLEAQEKLFIVTANPETLMIGLKNSAFDKLLKKKEVCVVPDGIGVVKAGNILGYKIKERVTGVDISKRLLDLADKTGKSIFLFGAEEEVLTRLVKKIKSTYPNIIIAGYSNGYVDDRSEVFERIADCAPDVVLVALGIPHQELLIHKFYDRFSKGIFVGVGGSFDVLSGAKKRAPQVFIKLNLEWLYRIIKEPKRIGRFCRSNIRFLVEIMKIKMNRVKKND